MIIRIVNKGPLNNKTFRGNTLEECLGSFCREYEVINGVKVNPDVLKEAYFTLDGYLKGDYRRVLKEGIYDEFFKIQEYFKTSTHEFLNRHPEYRDLESIEVEEDSLYFRFRYIIEEEYSPMIGLDYEVPIEEHLDKLLKDKEQWMLE